MNKLIHEVAKFTTLEWNVVKASFYVDGSCEDVVTTPREALKEGLNLFEGVECYGGWTRYGNCYVESFGSDFVETSRGRMTTDQDIVEYISNIMPYADGKIVVELYSEYMQADFTLESGEELSVVFKTSLYYGLMNKELPAYKGFMEALEAQLPDHLELALAYAEYIDAIENAREIHNLIYQK